MSVDRSPTEDEIVEAVREQFRPLGTPLAVYSGLHAAREVSPQRATVLSTQIVRNLEERLVKVERLLGVVDP